MVSGTLAPLKYLVNYKNVKQGSGLNRRQSPVEWGEILFIRPSICPPRSLSQTQGGPSQVLECPSQDLASVFQRGGRTDR